MQGLIGKKIGMTQVWDAQGRRVAVTVIEAGPCPVVQVKAPDKDGYSAVQLGFGEQKAGRLTKALAARYEKAGVTPCRELREFQLDDGEAVKAGDLITVGIFDGIAQVDVSATTKGRGFAGVVRRYRMAGGPMTHGGHSKRRVGGIGARDLPGWVHKGKRMPGHMGAVTRKARNLAVVQVRKDDNLLLVRGAIPGPVGGVVVIKKSLKKG
ncbi:MAG: 50S ribosomal protein L3 [Kiritimatiellia bacterium]